MALKHYKPTTPGQRSLTLIDRSQLHKGKPVKSLVFGLKSKGGRNNSGSITMRHQGGGHKIKYRLVDFKRNRFDEKATVVRFEYDPNRTAFIALIKYEDDTLSYILAPDKLKIGDVISSSQSRLDIKAGNTMPLVEIPDGILVHNVEMKVGKGGQIARSAGAYVSVAGKDNGYVQIKLMSGELRLVPEKCMATIGVLSNTDWRNVSFGKAGRKRWMGVRPTVRGVVMNPVDHPMGGGEGKTSGGRHPVSYSGVPAKGKKTRKKHAKSNKFIIYRKKSRR